MQTLEQQVSEDLRPQVHRLRVTNRWLAAAVVFLAAALVAFGAWMLFSGSSDELTEAEVDEIFTEYSVSLKAGDADSWIQLWAEDGVQLPPNAPAKVGKAAILADVEGEMAASTVTEFEILAEEVQSFDDLAYARGTYTAMIELNAGGDPILVDGKFLTVFQLQSDGSWLIYRDIFNSNLQ